MLEGINVKSDIEICRYGKKMEDKKLYSAFFSIACIHIYLQ